MRRFWMVSRRRFLWLFGVVGLARLSGLLDSAIANGNSAQNPAGSRASEIAPDYHVLSAHQVATLGAIAEQLIPADQDPGARDAGAVRYIDRVLRGEQSEKLPLYVASLVGTDQASQLLFGKSFIDLGFDRQTSVLKAIEQDNAPGDVWRTLSSRDFFDIVWRHVLEGFYGPPEHGGNQNAASWRMLGVPGH
jgi:gluconate 2-dehydrogenase gamma chain